MDFYCILLGCLVSEFSLGHGVNYFVFCILELQSHSAWVSFQAKIFQKCTLAANQKPHFWSFEN